MMRFAAATVAIGMVASAAIAQPRPVEITLIDLKLDIATMQGKTVAVTGLLQVMGDLVMLKGEPMDFSPVWVSTSGLSRDDRKSLITTCSFLCKATITGTVGKTQFGTLGVNASTLKNLVGVDASVLQGSPVTK